MAILRAAALLAGLSVLAGCVNGAIYTNVTVPLDINFDSTPVVPDDVGPGTISRRTSGSSGSIRRPADGSALGDGWGHRAECPEALRQSGSGAAKVALEARRRIVAR